MNINIKVEITAGTTRRLAYLGLTLLIFGISAAAYALPARFMSHERLTAAQLNEHFGALDERITAASSSLTEKAEKSQVPIVSEWTSYSPTLATNKSDPVAAQTTQGYYRRVGDTLEARLFTEFTAPPNSEALWWMWSLPEGLTIDSSKVGAVGLFSIGTAFTECDEVDFPMMVYVRKPQAVSAAPPGANDFINDTSPCAYAANANIVLQFSVPIQGWTVTQ